VIFRAPVPKFCSTSGSAIIGILRFMSGIVASFPRSFFARSSLGFIATATSAKIVSGRVVAILQQFR
jgi:hypothetical protein